MTDDDSRIIRQANEIYYYDMDRTWNNTKWCDVPTWKCPLDLWVYQELLTSQKVDVVIELGTWRGGSALFMAHVCDALNRGRIITVDLVEQPNRPKHPRIRYVMGDTTSLETRGRVLTGIMPGERVMAILDSDHHRDHVLKELNLYHPFVTPGCYMIVEDTNLNGNPVCSDHGPGPMEAVELFLKDHPEYVPDRDQEKFMLTFNPKGYLKRV